MTSPAGFRLENPRGMRRVFMCVCACVCVCITVCESLCVLGGGLEGDEGRAEEEEGRGGVEINI